MTVQIENEQDLELDFDYEAVAEAVIRQVLEQESNGKQQGPVVPVHLRKDLKEIRLFLNKLLEKL